MTPFLVELEEQLRGAAERQVAHGHSGPAVAVRHRFRPFVRAVPVAAAIGLSLVVFVLAVTFLHHGRGNAHPGGRTTSSALPVGVPAGPTRPLSHAAGGQIEQGTVKIAAEARDLTAGLPWGLETYRMTGGQTCVLAGREQGGRVGVIGQDGVFNNDRRFHPYTRYALSADCSQTDRNGSAFIDVGEPQTAASGDDQDIARSGCSPSRASARADHGQVCPAADERQLEYGLLGDDASSVTYTAGGHASTVPTGPDGAFIVVGPPTRASYVAGVSDQLMPGLVTAVHYRNGSTCRPRHLLFPRHESVECPPVGYVAPTHTQVTSAEVRAPVTASASTARRWCSDRSGYYLACDQRIPAGYRPLPHSAGLVLLQWSWIARVPASGGNSGYEYVIGGASSCGGGMSSSSPISARRGQRIVQQSLGSSPCAQRETISVEYRINVGPGGPDFASPANPGHDGQPLVGRTTIYVPR